MTWRVISAWPYWEGCSAATAAAAGAGGILRFTVSWVWKIVYERSRRMRQGLTLVHFSAQPEPFLTLKTSPEPLNTPSTLIMNTLPTPH